MNANGHFNSTARAGARGLVAAMAMTGTRRVTQNLGLLGKSPPEALVGERLPLTSRLSPETREVVIELAHWSYGAGAGAVFGALPEGLRRLRIAGPAYGIAMWLLFELGLAPLFGVQYAEERQVAGRVMLALDHVLYGVVVAGKLAPEPEEHDGDRSAPAQATPASPAATPAPAH